MSSPSSVSACRPMSKSRALLLAALLLAAGCGKRGPGGPGGMVVNVVGFKAAEQPLEERVSVVGTLTGNEWVDIKSELDGMVEEIGFQEGEHVEAGTLLFSIDHSKLAASLAEAEANLRMAEATAERYRALVDSRAVSQQEADQALTGLEARGAAVELMRAQLQDATITAPFAGTTGARQLSVGQYVTKGQQLTSLIDTRTMKAEFNVPERFLSRVAQGQPIDVRVAAYPDERFQGAVYFISPQVEASSRTVLVKARLPNPEDKLRAGMFANLDLILQVRERAIMVPQTALIVQGQTESVYVVKLDDTVEPRQVTSGVRQADRVEIVSGLEPGETVIVEGTQKVHPGASVSVRFEELPLPKAPLPRG